MIARKMKSWVVAFAFLLVVPGCAWPQVAPAQRASTPESTISPQAAKELLGSVDSILKFASEETGLPIKHEVKRKLVGRNEVQAYILKSMKDDKDMQRLKRSEAVLQKFGLVPRGFNLAGFLVVMLREQVAGYYDPKTNTVNLLDWVEEEQQRPVLAHELTHALQDQSIGLEKWMQSPGSVESHRLGTPRMSDIDDDEMLAARQAVAEGQGMVTLFDYTLAPTGQTLLTTPQLLEAMKQGMVIGAEDSPAFQSAPLYMKETLMFPYRYGLDFSVALLKAGGKELAFAGALKNPPRTTREIMEPETYLKHEKIEPMKLLNFDKIFKGYERFDIGAIGEFDVDVLVEQLSGPDEAAKFYPAWRGGYYFAGRPTGNKAAPLGLLYVSRWADAAKAAEFAAFYARALTQRYQQVQAVGADGKVDASAPPLDSWHRLSGRHVWMTEDGPVVINVRGDSIVISESLSNAVTKRAEADFWAETK